MKLYINCIIILFIFNTIIHSELCEFSSVDGEDVYNDILFDKHYKDIYANDIKLELITKMREEKCFVVTPYGFTNTGQTYLYVYKDFGILYTRTFNPNWYRDKSESFIHNLPNHILFVLKYTGAQNIIELLDMYKTNPEYFNQNYNTSYNICKNKINIMVENRSNEIAETKIRKLITIILYNFILVFIIIIFSIIIFNYIYKKQREIIFYEI